jgi:alpha-galactosidase
LRLSDYNSLVHSYAPTEVPIAEQEFAAEQLIMGPVLTWPANGGHTLLAYEHGSQYPDAYLSYRLGAVADHNI